jgi:hypothetical protein
MPAVYRELGSQAAKGGQKPTQFMAAVLTRAAGNYVLRSLADRGAR